MSKRLHAYLLLFGADRKEQPNGWLLLGPLIIPATRRADISAACANHAHVQFAHCAVLETVLALGTAGLAAAAAYMVQFWRRKLG
jgi:hypothetical protein